MEQVVLLKLGETVLKGLNRKSFEDRLINNLRRRLKAAGVQFSIFYAQSTVYVEPARGAEPPFFPTEVVVDIARKIFGAVSVALSTLAEKDLDDIERVVFSLFSDQLAAAKSFKVAAKRSDKSFPLNSPALCAELGARVLSKFPHLSVDLSQPDVIITVEVRDKGAYVHAGGVSGAGGLPAGSSGSGMVLISGGLDSPVAAWQMARRGLSLHAVHFQSPPYTGPQALQKVCDLLGIVAGYSGRIRLSVVGFTEIQEAIAKSCPSDLFTIVMRRFMMRIASAVAAAEGCECLVTGESLGQVASQTLKAMVVTDAAASLPVMRPLVGSDKEEIVRTARMIGTFETSILPYEDCCTVFTPKHPRTRPVLSDVEDAEAVLDIEGLVARALDNTQKMVIV